MNPLAVNVAGKEHYPATRAEAMKIIQEAQAAGKSFDVGMYQINSWWMERYDIPPVFKKVRRDKDFVIMRSVADEVVT